MISNLIEEITSFDNYNKNLLLFLDDNKKDWYVQSKYAHIEWVDIWQNSSNVLLQGLENKNFIKEKINKLLPDKKINSVHLFVNLKGGWSFNEHKDDTNVFLYVEKGQKDVHINGEIYKVKQNQGIHIPKGTKHKVDSIKDTWALSVGYD